MHEKRLLAGAALALALAACSNASDPSGAVAAGAAPGDAVEVVIVDGRFEPKTLEVPSGRPVTVEVTNNDGQSHDFAIRSLDLNTGTVGAGDVATAEVVVGDDPLEFVCTFHNGMKGTIVPIGGNGR